jgi:hypothetical protein
MQKKVSAHAVGLSMAPVVGIAVLLIGCGSNSPNSNSSPTLTQAQAQAVAKAVSNGINQALTSAFGAASLNASAKVMRENEIAPSATTPTCSVTSSGETCNWPISETFSCPGGGTMAVTGDVNGSVTDAGTGSIEEQIAATPASCSIDGIVISGAPQVTVGGQLNLSNWAPVWPLSGTEDGGVTYGPNPSGTCQFNVSFSINSDLSCTVSGTACGQLVNSGC